MRTPPDECESCRRFFSFNFNLPTEYGAVSNAFRNHGAGTDEGVRPEAHALDDGRPDADMAAVADLDATGDRYARRNVDVPSDSAIMIYGGARVDDGIVADDRIGLYDGAGHDLRTLVDDNRARENRRWVDDGRERETTHLEPIEDLTTPAGGAYAADAVDQDDASRSKTLFENALGHDLKPLDGNRGDFRIDDDGRFRAVHPQAIDHHLRVAATAKNRDGHGFLHTAAVIDRS